MDLKKCLALLLAALLLSAAAGCAPEPQEMIEIKPTSGPSATGQIGVGRTLVVGIWGSEQEAIVRELILPKFEAQTGATVELIAGLSSDRYALLYAEAEAQQSSMDVVYLSMAQTEQAAKDGLILPANPEGVPECANLYDIAKSVGGYGVSMMAVGLQYSTEAFPSAPTSWSACWDPANQGRVAPFAFPSTQGTAFLVMAAKLNGGDENNVDPGFEAIKKLKPLPAVFSDNDEALLAFESGSVVLAPQLDCYAAAAIDAAKKVGFTLPSEGGVLVMNCAAIPAKSANADLAQIWINMHLSQEVQQAYAERLYYGPTNSKVALSDDLAKKVLYGPDEVSKLIALDSAAIAANADAWAARWEQEVTGQ
ncbi:MAG: extracellular solute-binding protein [Bacillota bacterium]